MFLIFVQIIFFSNLPLFKFKLSIPIKFIVTLVLSAFPAGIYATGENTALAHAHPAVSLDYRRNGTSLKDQVTCNGSNLDHIDNNKVCVYK